MSVHGKVKRYYLIIEKVNRNTYPSIKEIQDYLLDHGFDVPRRTFVRDLAEIRLEFGIEITYDHSRKGYCIDRDNSLNFDTITKLLQTAISTDALLQNINDSRKVMNYVDYGSDVELKGMEHFEKLLMAVKENRVISFDHENYNKGTIKPYTLCPYLLKEYQKRWYVIGTILGTDSIRTFGIDRIENFKLHQEKFVRKESLNPKPYFRDIIGLNYSENELENVRLKVNAIQAKYFKAYPLHVSQTIDEEKADYSVLSFHLKPNYEFQEKLLSYAVNVVVLEPLWLVNQMKESLQKALKNYG